MKKMRYLFVLLAMVITGLSGAPRENFINKTTREVAYDLPIEIRALIDTVLVIDRRIQMKTNIIKLLNQY